MAVDKDLIAFRNKYWTELLAMVQSLSVEELAAVRELYGTWTPTGPVRTVDDMAVAVKAIVDREKITVDLDWDKVETSVAELVGVPDSDERKAERLARLRELYGSPTGRMGMYGALGGRPFRCLCPLVPMHTQDKHDSVQRHAIAFVREHPGTFPVMGPIIHDAIRARKHPADGWHKGIEKEWEE